MPKIYRIVTASVFRLPVPTKTWVILAIGETSSTGWTQPRLVRRDDKGGMLCFDFESDTPQDGDVSLPVLTPIPTVAVVSPPPTAIGVIISAESNSVGVDADVVTVGHDGNNEFDYNPYEIEQGVDDIEPEELDADEAHTELASPELLSAALRSVSMAVSGDVCKDKTLLKIWKGADVKTRGLKVYTRNRYSVTELHYCYPRTAEDAVRQVLDRCLPIAVAAGALAFSAGGPSGAVAAFTKSLEACAAAEVSRLVKVKVRTRTVAGRYKRRL